MAELDRDKLCDTVRKLDLNPTRASNYAQNPELALRVLKEQLRLPWPGRGEPRLDLRFGYAGENWQVLVYDFIAAGDPDGLGVRPYFHQTHGAIEHPQLAVAVCLAIAALAQWCAAQTPT